MGVCSAGKGGDLEDQVGAVGEAEILAARIQALGYLRGSTGETSFLPRLSDQT